LIFYKKKVYSFKITHLSCFIAIHMMYKTLLHKVSSLHRYKELKSMPWFDIELRWFKALLIVFTSLGLAWFLIVGGDVSLLQSSISWAFHMKAIYQPDVTLIIQWDDLLLRAQREVSAHTPIRIVLMYDPQRVSLHLGLIRTDLTIVSFEQPYPGRAEVLLSNEEHLLVSQELIRVIWVISAGEALLTIGQIDSNNNPMSFWSL